ncbi:MAG: class D sortase [Thermoanaerobaculia bacterium]
MALWVVGLSCLAWTGWALADIHLYQRAAAQLVGSTVAGDASGTAAARDVAAGTPLASLRIPRLDLEVVVAEGTDGQVLRRAVGRLTGGARLGEADNIVLAGHRDSFFRRLGELEVGDRIALERGGMTETYAVEWARVVKPDRVEVAGRTGYSSLTLVTCYPFWYVGNAPERYVVRAVKIS